MRVKGIKNHSQTNRLVKWTVVALDFAALWILLLVMTDFIPESAEWAGDILLSMVLLLPVIAIIIKRQSPGPVFFRQRRTGLDGRPWRDP